jgi:hypothetical protein
VCWCRLELYALQHQQKVLVNTARKLLVPHEAGNFLSSWLTIRFWRKPPVLIGPRFACCDMHWVWWWRKTRIFTTSVYLFIYDLLLRYSYNTWGLTDCSNNQFTTVSLWLFRHVRVKHLKVSAVKNKYYIKTLQRPDTSVVHLLK